ncbi:MAG: Glutamate--cysteine ligase EgtA [Gammaproteobacteria bacterium]|nr:Glutamate--cysteine ligase EgtA [Gammaproteobacteria bacterium]
MGFERYVEYMLDVPMYFVSREGRFIDAAGQSFRDFLAGRLPALLGERPTIRDWEDHLTTAFPEVRMKRFLEMRGADGGPWRRICALPALWVGLLYNASSLEGAWELVQDWSATERSNLLHDVNRHGFRARIRGMTVGELAGRVLEISRAGLAARNRVDDAGRSEEVHLEPLHKLVEQGKTAAEVMLEAYETRWRQNVDPVFSEYAY